MQLGDDYDIDSDFAGLLRKIRRAEIESEMALLLAKGLSGMSPAERERHAELNEALAQLKATLS
jgi:hypothetical protein